MTETVKKTKKVNQSTQKIVFCGVFSAIAFVLYLLEFPIIPALSYLKMDFSDVPALVGSVFFGPLFGIAVEFIKNAIELLFKGMGTQMGFGNLMNFLVGCSYIVPFSLIFSKIIGKKNTYKSASDDSDKRKLQKKAIVIASIVSIISIVLMGIIANYFITPAFFKYFLHIDITKKVLWGAIGGACAINAIKGLILSVLSYPFFEMFSKVRIK